MTFRTAASALHSVGGLARTRTLLSLGVTARELSRAVREHEVLRPRQGVYALPDADDARVHATEHGGVPGCITAARLHGLWVIDDQRIHVWLGPDGHARSDAGDGCRLHWSAGRVFVEELPPVSLTLLQIAHCADEETFFSTLESALHQGVLSSRERAWLRSALPRRMRWLVDFARSDAGSGIESIVRLRLHRHGISVRTQVRVYATGDVDLLIGDWLLIELDGRLNHDGESLRHKDLMRDANSAIWGYETLRFDYAMVMHDWDIVEAAILAKVAAGAHLRPPR